MKLINLLEADNPSKFVVVFGGRFQPFHVGHYRAYKKLVKRFGASAVWIATSSKTNFDPTDGKVSPLTFHEKVELITELYDIPEDKIVKCKNPAFSPVEIFNKYKGYDITYVAACGAKDVDRYQKSDTFVKFPAGPVSGVAKLEGKSYYLPLEINGPSGTVVRQSIDAGELESKFEKLFGRKYDADVAALLSAKIKEVK